MPIRRVRSVACKWLGGRDPLLVGFRRRTLARLPSPQSYAAPPASTSRETARARTTSKTAARPSENDA
jgi:hypothetical protein